MTTQTATSNKAIVSSMYDAFKRGDIPYILNQIDDNCAWNVMGAPQIPYGGTYQGKGASRFFQVMTETIEVTLFEAQEFIENEKGDVVAFGIYSGKGKKTGKTFDSKWAMSWRFKNGKVVYLQNYYDTAHVAAVL